MVFVTASVSSVSHAPPASEVDFSPAASAAALLVLLGAVGAAESDIIARASMTEQRASEVGWLAAGSKVILKL